MPALTVTLLAEQDGGLVGPVIRTVTAPEKRVLNEVLGTGATFTLATTEGLTTVQHLVLTCSVACTVKLAGDSTGILMNGSSLLILLDTTLTASPLLSVTSLAIGDGRIRGVLLGLA